MQSDKRLLWHPRQDNKFIVGGNSQITLYEWAAEHPEIRHVTSRNDLAHMKCFAWSPDPGFEDLLAVGVVSGRVDLIRLEESRQARQSKVLSSNTKVSLNVRHTRACNALAFCTPDPNYLAVGLDKVRSDPSLIIWDISSARQDLAIKGLHTDGETRVMAVPPMPSRPQPQIPRIGNPADPRILQPHAPTEAVSSLAFLPNSTHVLLAGISNRWLRIFDLRASAPSASSVATKVHGIATDPFDPHRIACYGENTVTVWDARKVSQPLIQFTEQHGVGDGAKPRAGAAYIHIEFSRTRRGCLSTLEKDGSYVRFWDLTETRNWLLDGSGSVFGGSSDGESRAARDTRRRSWWAAGQSQVSNSSKRDSPVLNERHQAAYVLADTRRTKTFSKPLASFAMVPHNLTNPLACNVMIVNKEGDLELYQVHDTPKQAAWSARGDLTIGAGMGLKVFAGFRKDEAVDELQSDGTRNTSSLPFNITEKDQASRSLSATRRESSQIRGRASKHPPVTPLPLSSALFGRDDDLPALSGVSAQLALATPRGNKHRAYSPSPFRKYKAGERPTDGYGPNQARGWSQHSRSRERRKSPSPARGKSAKGSELRSKGVTSVLEEDISMIMHRRALLGYGLSKPNDNMSIVLSTHETSGNAGQDLSEVWAWIHHSRELLCTPTPQIHGYDFSNQGLIGIWEGLQPATPPQSQTEAADETPTAVNRSLLLDVPAAAPTPTTYANVHERQPSRRSHSPADDLHGNWQEALSALARRRGGERSLWKPPVPTTKLPQRQVALQLCGWSLRDDELHSAVSRWEREGKFSRAACWLVFTKQYSKAMELLMRSDDDVHQMMSGTIAALSPHGSSSLKNSELREHYSKLIKRMPDPYLRMIIIHMAVGDWTEVLKEDIIPFRERLAIAFQFLDDKTLTSSLRRMTDHAFHRGNIEAIIITGLTKAGLNILQAYVDRTGDVQTAAVMGSYVHPIKFKDHRAENWLQTYRDLLDGFKLHRERVSFDIERGQLLSDAVQSGNMQVSEEWVPRQILIRCHYCNKPVNGTDMMLPNLSQKGRPTACPNCHRALPKCSVCLMTLAIVNDASRELELGYSHFKDTIDDAIVICQTCRHGGHAAHILEWFLGEDGKRAHGVCPVAGCDCRCADEF